MVGDLYTPGFSSLLLLTLWKETLSQLNKSTSRNRLGHRCFVLALPLWTHRFGFPFKLVDEFHIDLVFALIFRQYLEQDRNNQRTPKLTWSL